MLVSVNRKSDIERFYVAFSLPRGERMRCGVFFLFTIDD
jgi:hypothetical protein